MPAINSRLITFADYRPATSELDLTFATGATYTYFAVPARIYERLLAAGSKGAFFNAEIKDVFPFRQGTAARAPRASLAPPLRILAAGSMLHGLMACAALTEQAAGTLLSVATRHGHDIRDAVLRGEAEADVVLLPEDMIAALAAHGLVRESLPLGTVCTGGVVREGAPLPDIATMSALRAALLAADAVLLTRAPTGGQLLAAITRMGIGEDIAPKVQRFDTASAINRALAARSGDARSDSALGFSPETEIRAGTGVTYAGDVPAEIQITLPYAAAILSRSAMPDAAGALLTFLASAPAREAFRASGVRF
jgi:molybdate transport system substrate-binding protein